MGRYSEWMHRSREKSFKIKKIIIFNKKFPKSNDRLHEARNKSNRRFIIFLSSLTGTNDFSIIKY